MNKVMLMGRLTKDPETRYSQNQVAVTRFTIAVNRRFTKPGEERQADFLHCVCFRSTAEFVSKYFVKGQQLALVGSLQSRKWEDEAGKSHTVIEVVAEEVYFADSKRERDGAQPQSSGFGNGGGYTAPAAPARTPDFSDDDGFMPIDDDNLPF